MVLWSLSPGFRGGASWRVASGAARVVAVGQEAQGDAGRMGGADCPVLLVTGPCTLEWVRTGRLYGSPPAWRATFDGSKWAVEPFDLRSDEEREHEVLRAQIRAAEDFRIGCELRREAAANELARLRRRAEEAAAEAAKAEAAAKKAEAELAAFKAADNRFAALAALRKS